MNARKPAPETRWRKSINRAWWRGYEIGFLSAIISGVAGIGLATIIHEVTATSLPSPSPSGVGPSVWSDGRWILKGHDP